MTKKTFPFIPSKQYYCVIDFEANCTGSNVRDHEIIEFPAVLIEANTGDVVAEFRRFVRTIKTGKVSKFINDLTHITDDDLNGPISCTWWECVILFQEWCDDNEITEHNTTVVTCGDWDLKTMFTRQLLITKTQPSEFLVKFFGAWNNVKHTFKRAFNRRRAPGMAGMLAELNITLVGHHHSGIDDCRNIAKICHALTLRGEDSTMPNRIIEENYWYCIGHQLPYRRTKKGVILQNEKYEYFPITESQASMQSMKGTKEKRNKII